MEFVEADDINALHTSKTIKVSDDISMEPGYYVSVRSGEIKCDCGKCPSYSGQAIIGCEDAQYAADLVVALRGYIKMVQVRKTQVYVDRMIEIVTNEDLDEKANCPYNRR